MRFFLWNCSFEEIFNVMIRIYFVQVFWNMLHTILMHNIPIFFWPIILWILKNRFDCFMLIENYTNPSRSGHFVTQPTHKSILILHIFFSNQCKMLRLWVNFQRHNHLPSIIFPHSVQIKKTASILITGQRYQKASM
jgi:hypothetical protein